MILTYNSPTKIWRHHLWRIFRQYCRQRALCPTRSFQSESRRNRLLMRWNHNLFTHAALGCHSEQEGRCRRSRRIGRVKFGHAFGAHVVVFTTSPNKKEDALRLGADEVVISRNTDEMNKHVNSFDFILDAVSAGARH